MRPRAQVVMWAALAACSQSTPSERERALERIPAQAQLIFAADGPALSNPAFRRILDVARSHIPTTLACVAEAATTSEAIAGGTGLNGSADAGTTIVLVTRAVVAHCPALSRIGEHLYVATIGAGAPAPDRAHSVLADATWERARPYLLREPFALAAELPDVRALAVAQPDPLDAWVAIDALDAAALETQIKRWIAHYGAGLTSSAWAKLAVSRKGTQVSVRSDHLDDTELAGVVADLLDAADHVASTPAVAFACPPAGDAIVACHDGTHIQVRSLAELVRELSAVDAEQVVSGNDVIGIRFTGDPPHLFRRNDVLLGIGARRVTDSKQLAAMAKTVGDHESMAVRRDGVEVVLDLTE